METETIDRKKIVCKIKRVVIKIGTNVLTHGQYRLDSSLMEHLGEQVSWLVDRKRQVVIVTSGAIGAGMQILGWKKRPKKIEKLQTAASVGQSRLMRFYERIFREEGHNVGQVLLTRDIFESRERRRIARATLETLLAERIIPIVNENDAVAVEEIKFGDNDQLSAMVVELLDADALVLLSNVDGFFTIDPKDGNRKSHLQGEIVGIREKHRKIAIAGRPSDSGSGGMASKIRAIEYLLKRGKVCFLANGMRPWIIKKIFEGQQVGTIFIPRRMV
jgi:glutamate 5-kinase